MTGDHWAAEGPRDEAAHGETVPAFIEVLPDYFKRVDDCTADELSAAANARMVQARALMDDARRLYEMAEERTEE